MARLLLRRQCIGRTPVRKECSYTYLVIFGQEYSPKFPLQQSRRSSGGNLGSTPRRAGDRAGGSHLESAFLAASFTMPANWCGG